MSHDRSGEIANIDDLDPGQEYYIIGAHWGAALHASKVGDKVDMTTGHGGAWNPGQSGGEKMGTPFCCRWTIQRADGGYNIRSVEHGSRSEGSSVGLTASKGSSAGLAASKEPFAWTVEPQNKGDGVFRFTVPHTEVHVDFSSVASVDQSAGGEDTEVDFAASDQTTESDFAASELTTESDFAASELTTEADFAASELTTESDFAASESDEAAFAREMAAAGHNFDPNFKAGGELNAGGSVEANGGTDVEANGGSSVEANGGNTAEEGAGPTLHAFGRPYGFPPGYFSK
ncbi:uncharacterized protein SCHCODRAFT_02519382 [Schizophyllum commune H4-8]|nr:uncharacterized protein SCHCODRAFT_02519382 [Schizophyllum commune H4-8]KAI5886218.1 hypothetical protein SCHCODRAFT_02519382 [Schizophyllum commune H4-8]